MGSGDFHKNQYESGRGDEVDNLKKKVRLGMRAVLQNYISREQAGSGKGMGKFDALIHDRISEWRAYERNAKIKKIIIYFILSFFIVPMMLMTGTFSTWLGIAAFIIGVFLFSYALQFIKTITIRAFAPSDSKQAREGVKKAIADIWFETLYSVKIAYFVGFLMLFIWGVVGYYLGENLDQYLAYFINIIINFFGVSITHVDTYFFVNLILMINAASLLGDYLFWKINYRRVIQEV